MGRGLFITMMGHGHVNPTLGLVKELIKRGEKISYIAGFEFEEIITKTGAEYIGYNNIMNPANFAKGSRDISKIKQEEIEKIVNRMGGQFVEMAEKIFELKEKFDYLVYDSAFGIAEEVGRILDIPIISSTTTFLLNKNIIEERPEANFGKIGRYIRENMKVDSEFALALKSKYGINLEILKKKDRKMANGNLNIVYTSRYFQPRNEDFDSTYLFIGASVTDRKEDKDFVIDKSKKILYISLGTLFNKSVEFYKNCFNAFKDMNVNVVMSVGKNIDIKETFNEIPDNFIVRNYVPQLEVLKEADIFLTHGGMNSTNEGLYYDIPLILIPQSVDQPFVANIVSQLNAGLVIDKDHATEENLRNAVEKIITDSKYKENSSKIGKSLRDGGGYKKGVDEILKVRDSYKKKNI